MNKIMPNKQSLNSSESPKWINKYLSKEEIQNISKTVEEVEKHTRGEVVPIIVSRSSDVSYLPTILTLIILLAIVLVNPFHFFDLHEFTNWWYLILATIVGYGISIPACKNKFIQKIMIPEPIELSEVFKRAELEFYRNRVHKTELGTGVLIFISIMEKKAVILADKIINDKLQPGTLEKLVSDMIAEIADNKWYNALNGTITKVGSLLREHVPAQNGKNSNELSNHLIIKD